MQKLSIIGIYFFFSFSSHLIFFSSQLNTFFLIIISNLYLFSPSIIFYIFFQKSLFKNKKFKKNWENEIYLPVQSIRRRYASSSDNIISFLYDKNMVALCLVTMSCYDIFTRDQTQTHTVHKYLVWNAINNK